jgi:CheY-like chemotaxis protein
LVRLCEETLVSSFNLSIMAKHVLYVEQRKDLLYTVPILLRHRGLKVTTVSSPLDAEAMLCESDVLVMAINDLFYSSLNGFLARYRHDRWKPAIAMTGFVLPKITHKLHEVGFDQVVPEPLDINVLISAIRDVSQRQQHSEMSQPQDYPLFHFG